MENTGILQASIAYKVTADGNPVDIDGELTQISGKRQAIAILEGTINPDPSVYEVESYFNPRSAIGGEPSIKYSLNNCPVYYIRASVPRVVLTNDQKTGEVTIFSSNAWQVAQGQNAIISPIQGAEGATVVSFTKNEVEGDAWYDFTNLTSNQVARIRVISVNSVEWILETGEWNDLGFWKPNGVWNY